MARPVILIQEQILSELYDKHKEGFKYNTMLRKYKLHITAPTIKKLIMCYSIYVNVDDNTKHIVYKSLFPEWLVRQVQLQNTVNWVYKGTFPLGSWQRKINKKV